MLAVGREPTPESALGFAVAGFLDPARERVAFAPHLPWREAAVSAEMSARIGLPGHTA